MKLRLTAKTFADSIMTLAELNPTLTEVAGHLSRALACDIPVKALNVESRGFDARLGWNTFAIQIDGVDHAYCNVRPTQEGIAEIPEEELAFYASSGISNIRRLQDGVIVGTSNMFSTVALLVDIQPTQMCSRRYCYPFQHERHVLEALEMFTDSTVHAIGPWVKCKGMFKGRPIDLLNPLIGNDDDTVQDI